MLRLYTPCVKFGLFSSIIDPCCWLLPFLFPEVSLPLCASKFFWNENFVKNIQKTIAWIARDIAADCDMFLCEEKCSWFRWCRIFHNTSTSSTTNCYTDVVYLTTLTFQNRMCPCEISTTCHMYSIVNNLTWRYKRKHVCAEKFRLSCWTFTKLV